MFTNNINPTLLQIGPFEIRYYGIIFALGFLITYLILRHLVKQREIKLTKDDLADLMFWLAIGVVIGARVFYILFYNPYYYLSNPLMAFALWQGGLSFHGGLIGAFSAVYLFCKKKKIDFMELADLIVIPAAIALALGRIGNFLNSELVGRATDVPWAVKFKGSEGYRHPSQIYESFKNIFIFGVLWVLKDKKLPKGCLFFIFVMMYSFLRFFIEFFREPDPQLGFIIFGLTMGQILNILMFLIGGFFLLKINKK